MAVTAGYKTSISVSAAAATGYAALGYCTDTSFSFDRGDLDTTAFVTASTAAKMRIVGLKWNSVRFTCDYDPADSGQAIIIARWADGASCWVQVKWDDSAGDNVETKVVSMPKSSSPAGKVTIVYTCESTGLADTSMH